MSFLTLFERRPHFSSADEPDPLAFDELDDEAVSLDSSYEPDVGRRLTRLGQRDYNRLRLIKIAYADSLERAGRAEDANLLRNCCNVMFKLRYERGEVLRGINECKQPICPTAQIARANRQHAIICEAVDRFLDKNPGLQGIMLTLTVASCPSHELFYRLGEFIKAFGRLTTFAKFKRAVKAYVRAIEITRNAITCEWHIHAHVALFCSIKEYFRKGSTLYISQAEWQKLWRKALRATYDPIVDVRALRGVTSPLSDIGRKSMREIIKYPLKPSSLIYWLHGRAITVGGQKTELYRIKGDDRLQPMLDVPLLAFADAVKGRRLIATSRNLQGNDDLDFTDDLEDEINRRNLGAFICVETYIWRSRGADSGFFLVSRSFDDPADSRKWGLAMGP